MEGESGVTRGIMDEIQSSDIQEYQMEGELDVTRSIIDDFHSWDIPGDKMDDERKVLLKESSMNLILRISNEIKWKVKVVLPKVSLMKFILRRSK